VSHGVEVQRAVKRLDVGGRALYIERWGGRLLRRVLDHQVPLGRGRLRHQPRDRLGSGGLLRRRLSRPAPGARQRLRGIAVHRIGGEQATEPFGGLVVAAAAVGDLRQDLEGQDVLGIERQDFAKHVGGAGLVLLIDQAAPEDDVRADVIRVQLEAGGAQLEGPI